MYRPEDTNVYLDTFNIDRKVCHFLWIGRPDFFMNVKTSQLNRIPKTFIGYIYCCFGMFFYCIGYGYLNFNVYFYIHVHVTYTHDRKNYVKIFNNFVEKWCIFYRKVVHIFKSYHVLELLWWIFVLITQPSSSSKNFHVLFSRRTRYDIIGKILCFKNLLIHNSLYWHQASFDKFKGIKKA